jgi:uncharacterized protein YdhG (YjbR/CyaY superfamily)
MHQDVKAYIDNAPEDQRDTLKKLRAMIVSALPDAEEVVESGFPVYKVAGEWTAGWATRKKGPMLYIMVQSVLDKYEDRLGKLRSGKSCIEFRETKDLPIATLTKLAEQMLIEARNARSA